jgi:hypothetical protein
MSRTQVLEDNHLVAGGYAFARGNDRLGENHVLYLRYIRIHKYNGVYSG